MSKNILILGYPGQVAIETARTLAEKSFNVFLLVPKNHKNIGIKFSNKYKPNITLLTGSGDHIDLGLDGKQYLDLLKTIDKMLCLYSPMKYPKSSPNFFNNLTVELKEFIISAKKLKRLIFLSNINLGKKFNSIFAENDLNILDQYISKSEQPAYRCEKCLKNLSSTYPITVIRTPHIIGCNEKLYPLAMLALAKKGPFQNPSNVKLQLATLNSVANFILWLVKKNPPVQTFHYFEQDNYSTDQFVKYSNSIAKELLSSHYDFKSAALKRLKADGFSKQILSEEAFSDKILQNQWTMDFLKDQKAPTPTGKNNDVEQAINYAAQVVAGFK